MASGGGGAPTQQNVTTTTSNLPEYARPYFQNLMGRAEANLNTQYQPYNAPRLAGFTPAQEQIQQNILGMQAPNQFGTGSALAYQAGLGALQQQYSPSQFTAQQIGMPSLQQFQMGPAMQVSPYQSPQQGGRSTGSGYTQQTTPDGRSMVTIDRRMPGYRTFPTQQQQSPEEFQRGIEMATQQYGRATVGAPPAPGTDGEQPTQTAPQMGGVTPQPSGSGAVAPQMATAQTQFQPTLAAFQMGPTRDVSSQAVGAPTMQGAQTGFRPDLNAFQMGNVREVSSQMVGAPEMQAAQTGFGQQPLEQFRMAGPEMFGSEQVQRYMSPFLEQALEPQLRSAVSDARRAQIAQDLGAARQGTYGGSRQLLASMEREKNLAQQMGDIRARGMQAAFEQAQQQFERDRAAGMTTGQANLQAALQQQQLGTQTGLQAALANLSNEQQARVNNQAMQFQAQGMNQEQAMRAALANQGVDVTRAQQNLAAQLGVQELGTQTGLQTALANLSNEQQARVNNQAMQFQAQGMNAENALRAALANQGVDVTRAQANQQAALGVQQLGTQTGLQAALANLDAASQANVQNLAAQLQTQGLNADQAMRAALANQQAGLTVGQQNLQALLQTQQLGTQTGLQAALANQQQALEAQRLAEQSRQFGAQQGLAGLQAAGQMGQTLGNLGQYQQQANLQRLQAQSAAASEQRGFQQQLLDQAYADFLRQRDYPMEVLGQYSNLLRGLPIGLSSTQTTYAPPPSMASQVLGTGLGALGMARTLGG